MLLPTVDVRVNLQSVNISPTQFTDWLKGYLDATGGLLTLEQVEQIKQKLATVRACEPVQWYRPLPFNAPPPTPPPGNDFLITWGSGT